jgi:DNA end-binding protein Ku
MPPLRTGLLSFGLVSIPVQLHTATKDLHIAFNFLHAKCGSRVQNRYYCPVCNEVVERDDRIPGYEFAKNQYAQLNRARTRELETESKQIGFWPRLSPRANRAAIAQLVTRGKEQLVLIRPYQGGLIMHRLYYANQVRNFGEIAKAETLLAIPSTPNQACHSRQILTTY